MRVAVFLDELGEHGFDVVAVMCGQGLTEHVELVEKTLREGNPYMETGKYPDILVYRAASTWASEENGVDMDPDHRAYSARERRREPDGQPE